MSLAARLRACLVFAMDFPVFRPPAALLFPDRGLPCVGRRAFRRPVSRGRQLKFSRFRAGVCGTRAESPKLYQRNRYKQFPHRKAHGGASRPSDRCAVSPAVNLLRAAATVSSLTLLSRVTGLIRDLLISRIFGVSGATDAFNVAFRMPNLLRRLFAEGAFQQAFVPMLADVRAHGDDRTRDISSITWPPRCSGCCWVSVAGVVAAPVLVWLIATGLAREPAAFELATTMTRWMFPYILCMSLVALAAGVLNTFRRFAVPAVTPVVLNLSFIACALWLAPRLATPICFRSRC